VLRLDRARDYRLVFPSTPVTGAVVVDGGHNVVIVGGEIRLGWQGAGASIDSRRGLYLANQTGTVHVEGLLIDGSDLSEGIDLSEPLGAIVQIENVRVDRIHARDEKAWSDNHPDLLQTWAGPAELRVDRFTGSTDYQALFLAPMEYGSQPPPRAMDVRHVNVSATTTCWCILMWVTPGMRLTPTDVWLQPNPWVDLAHSLWPTPAAWLGVRAGVPPGGDFVPVGVAGAAYRSPGYASA
jgi:hypothetical protein